MAPISDITGVILAGGQSSRFGSNKALALLHGKSLISHVTDIMSAIFTDHLLVTNTPEQYDFLNMPMIKDQYPGMGPLAGIHAALMQINTSRAFVVACDMPNVSPELIRYLCSIDAQEYDVVIPWLEKGQEPLFGIYHKKSLPIIDSFLQQKKCQVTMALKKLQVRRVNEDEILSVTDDLACFKNINRPADL
jgi:molybdopterin-guanine dinucleotide biosynthesis protein A